MAVKKKKATRKPTPGMLGTGGAAKAGRGLANRGRQIDAAVDAQTGAKKKKK